MQKDPLYRERIDLIQKAFIFGIIVIFCCALISLLFGCASLPTSSPVSAPAPKYELMLSGSIDSTPFAGIGIGSAAAHHNITVNSAIAVNYFTMESCHRSVQFSDIIPPNPWYVWGQDSKSFSFSYDEAPTIEDDGDCLLRFCAFSKVVGSPPVSCAIVDFHNAKYSLPAQDICNGTVGNATGTMFCHTQVGLLERVKFKESVQIAPQVTDPTGKSAPYWIKNQCRGKFLDVNQTLFEYQVPENECVLIFDQIAKPHARAKLTVIPFDQALYPGGQ